MKSRVPIYYSAMHVACCFFEFVVAGTGIVKYMIMTVYDTEI